MTLQDNNEAKKPYGPPARTAFATLIGVLVLIAIVITTVIIAQSGISEFVTNNLRYILSIEIIVLAVYFIEMLARLVTTRSTHIDIIDHSANWRLIVRIIGYLIGLVSVISILAANTTLGISVGTVIGIVIAFATQNTASSVLAAIIIISTRMIRIGEEITIQNQKGTVHDIGLTHTILSVDDDVLFVPNSVIVANVVRRRKRITGI